MVGAGINVIPFMIQRHVPGINQAVLPAFALAAVPAVLAGLAYATLASAMPRAGGAYVYASRGLHPYLGFVASFSQWFALSVAIGVVSYVLVPFLRDIAQAADWPRLAGMLEQDVARLAIPLVVLWAGVGVNLRGITLYQRLVVPLMFLTLLLGAVVIIAGFSFDHADYASRVPTAAGRGVPDGDARPVAVATLISASVLLFASFIGFDAIAQAGGEARHPGRDLPLAIALAVGLVAIFYMLFTAAVYHAVPWPHVAREAAGRDLTAPGLLGPLLPRFWTIVIVSAAAVALVKDLPPMLLSVSRLMFAWAEDGIFPAAVARVHPVHRTPHVAVLISGVMASVSVLGCHLAGDFFLGIDILVFAMLVNFLLMTVTVLTLPRRNPPLDRAVTVLPSRRPRAVLAAAGVAVLALYLAVHAVKDLSAPVAWYMRSTVLWAAVMAVGTIIYAREVRGLRRRGVDLEARFATLPPD